MKRVTRVVAEGQGQVVLADDVVFVNNGGAVGNGIQAGDTIANGANGTAEHPFNTVTEGATVAGTNANAGGKVWTVYTQGGTGFDYTGTVNVTGSTRFLSSFHPLMGAGGTQFGGGTVRPILNGRFLATSIPFLQITAYDVRASGFASVGVTNVQELIVTENLLANPTGGSPVTVNTNGATVAQSLVSGNRITGTVGNPAIFFSNFGTSSQTATVAGNEIDGNYINGMSFGTIGGGTIHATVRDNTLTGSYSGAGIAASASSSGVGVSNVHVDAFNNTLSGTFVAGIRYQSSGSGTSSVGGTAQGNVLDGTFGDGVHLTAASATTLDVTVTDNELSGTFTNGIHAEKHGTSDLTADTIGNTLSGTFSAAGIRYFGDGGIADGFIGGTVEGNVLSGNFLDGIELRAQPAVLDVAVANNHLSGTFRNGIAVWRSFGTIATSFVSAEITGNLLSGGFSGDGITFTGGASGPLDNSTTTQLTIADNQLTGDFARGIVLFVSNNNDVEGVVRNNVLAAGSTYDTYGIYFRVFGTVAEFNITQFEGNVINGMSGTGIFIDRDAGTMTINGALDPALSNQVTNETGDKLESGGTPTGQFYLNGNLITLPATVN